MTLPLNPGSLGEEALFRPEDFLAYMRGQGRVSEEESAPLAVILSYQRGLFDHAVRRHGARFHSGYFQHHLAYLPETDGRVAIAGRFGIGAPAAAALLEELIAFGARAFVSIGTAGALVPRLRPGDVTLCSGALRDEGVSYHYAEASEPALPDPALSRALSRALAEADIAHGTSLSWTTDGLYRETKSGLKAAVAQGAATVEMEASALFTVARYRKVPLAAAFTISDTLAEPEWQPDFLARDTSEGLERLYGAALSALRTTLETIETNNNDRQARQALVADIESGTHEKRA